MTQRNQGASVGKSRLRTDHYAAKPHIWFDQYWKCRIGSSVTPGFDAWWAYSWAKMRERQPELIPVWAT
jgi:hypothetical protein